MRNTAFWLVTIFFAGIFVCEIWFYLYHPLLLWHQLLSHPIRSILSVTLVLGAIGFGIYFFVVRWDDRLTFDRKLYIFIISTCLLALNSLICGGIEPFSLVMLNILIIGAMPLVEKAQAEIKAGTRPGLTAKELKARLWVLIGSALGGVVIFNLFTWPALTYNPSILVTINVLLLAVIGLFLWFSRRNLFS